MQVHSFDSYHYVPVLRWKQAEYLALRRLDQSDRALLTPLVEPVPKRFEGSSVAESEMDKLLLQLEKNLGQFLPFFLGQD